MSVLHKYSQILEANAPASSENISSFHPPISTWKLLDKGELFNIIAVCEDITHTDSRNQGAKIINAHTNPDLSNPTPLKLRKPAQNQLEEII